MQMGLQVGPAFYAFSRPPFAARLRAAEPLSIAVLVRHLPETADNISHGSIIIFIITVRKNTGSQVAPAREIDDSQKKSPKRTSIGLQES